MVAYWLSRWNARYVFETVSPGSRFLWQKSRSSGKRIPAAVIGQGDAPATAAGDGGAALVSLSGRHIGKPMHS